MDNILNLTQYMRVINAILLNRYDEHNLQELIIAILFLLKCDESHREILMRFVKTKVNRSIRQSIANTDNIYDILIKLIHIMNNSQRNNRASNNNQRRNTRNRNSSNTN